jgi:hypothetical protein
MSNLNMQNGGRQQTSMQTDMRTGMRTGRQAGMRTGGVSTISIDNKRTVSPNGKKQTLTYEPEFTIPEMTEKEADIIINNFYKTLIEESYEKIPEDYKQIINNEPDKIKMPESNINYSEMDYPKVEKICESMFEKLTPENQKKLMAFLEENKQTDADFITKIEYYTMLNIGDEQETGEQYFNIKYFFETYDGVIPKGETSDAS